MKNVPIQDRRRRFEGRVALVTGGSAGIGLALAAAFAGEGAKVVIAARREHEGEEAAQSIRESGGEACFLRADISRAEDVEAMIAETVRRYGRLDHACNNAGVEDTGALTADCTEEEWDRLMAVNLKGVWLSMKHEIPEIIRAGGGCIVNVSSVNGLIAVPESAPYTASKHAVVGLTKVAALEYARKGVRINAVCPGGVVTPMHRRIMGGSEETSQQLLELHPAGRIADPREVADAVTWLCSGAASFVIGHAMAIEGGWAAR